MPESPNIVVKPSPADATEACASLFRQIVTEAVGEHAVCCVALAGGTTPHALYAYLARKAISPKAPWQNLELFFGDERDVPQDHVESNYHMVQRTLLDKVPIPLDRIHPMPADADDLPAAAVEYEETIRRVVPAGADGVPRFDLILLGMGGDGHTASLFPHTEALKETGKMVASHFVPVLGRNRMTFTFPLINAAKKIILMVTGADKAEAVERLLKGTEDVASLPAAGVAPTDGELTIVLDMAATRRAGLTLK